MLKKLALTAAITASLAIAVAAIYGAWQGYQAFDAQTSLIDNPLFYAMFGAFKVLFKLAVIFAFIGGCIYLITMPIQFCLAFFDRSEGESA